MTASTTTGGTLSYLWSAAEGTLTSSSANPSIWKAPASAGTYQISVDVSDGTSTVRASVTVVVSVTPVTLAVTGVLPAEAKVGDSIRIYGTGFMASKGSSTVSLGSLPVTSIQSWSDTEIHATVPANATTGDVTVNVGGVVSNGSRLTVLWGVKNPLNVAVVNNASTQTAPVLAPDSQGGAIVAWVDYRNGNADVYVQRVDSSGKRLWASGGVAVTTASNYQLSPEIVADGSGGAVVVWHDFRDGLYYNIYAQRINATGNVLWTVDGVAVAGMTADQTMPRLMGDGSGGAVIVWQDYRSTSNFDIYAQHLDGNANPLWTVGGVAVVTAAGNQFNPQLVSDNSGGVIVAWEDYRGGSNFDIYSQRIDLTGIPQWTADGISVSNAAGDQSAPQIAADGSGGAVIVWQDYRSGGSFDIYGQQLNSAGTAGWTINGKLIAAATDNQMAPKVALTGQNMFTIAWEDYRNGNADLYAQRINNLGSLLWVANGVAVVTATGDQKGPRVVADDASGVIVAWEDHRLTSNAGIYSQRIGPGGTAYWTSDGEAISTASGDQLAPQVIANNGGGAILVWEDRRNSSADIYAQGISAGGNQ